MGDDDFEASPGSPRIYELIQDAPKTGSHPKVGAANTIWAWPEVVDFLKIAGQPVPGPWPPHQEQRPDPTVSAAEPTAVAEPAQEAADIARKRGDAAPGVLSYRRGGETAQPAAPAAEESTMTSAERAAYNDREAFQRGGLRPGRGPAGATEEKGVVWKGGSLKDLKPGE